MKIKVEEDVSVPETEIIIRCKAADAEIDHIVNAIKSGIKVIHVKKEGESRRLFLSDVYYFESVDEKVFCYDEKELYDVPGRLYEIENRLANTSFIRVNKNVILNTDWIDSFQSQLNGRMLATLKNGEKVDISRFYVPALKDFLRSKSL